MVYAGFWFELDMGLRPQAPGDLGRDTRCDKIAQLRKLGLGNKSFDDRLQ